MKEQDVAEKPEESVWFNKMRQKGEVARLIEQLDSLRYMVVRTDERGCMHCIHSGLNQEKAQIEISKILQRQRKPHKQYYSLIPYSRGKLRETAVMYDISL